MLWGGRWEAGSCLGTHVRIKDFKIKKKKKKLLGKSKHNRVKTYEEPIGTENPDTYGKHEIQPKSYTDKHETIN